MPQGRIVLKSICQSKKIALLKTDGARLLYTWLIPNLDINGCFSGDEDVVNGQIFTRLKKTPKHIGEFLQDLHDNGLIQWYEFDEDKFLIVPDFADKQPSLNPTKEAKSTIPEFTPDLLLPYSVSTPPKVKGSKAKGSESKVKEKDDFFVSEFNKARTLYPATKRGNTVEFNYFKKTHKEWKAIIPLLLPAIQKQMQWRKEKGPKDFRPGWKNFKTWIYNSNWEDSVDIAEATEDNKACVNCHAAYVEGKHKFTMNNVTNQKEYRCAECRGAK